SRPARHCWAMTKVILPRFVVGLLLGATGLLCSGCFLADDDGKSSGNTGGGSGDNPAGTGGSSGNAECGTSAECGDGRQCVSGACRPVDDSTDDNYCAPTIDWPESSAAKELEILDLVNQYRAAGASCGGEFFGPREPLEMLGSLQCAARVHSLDMLENDYFSHTRSEERRVGKEGRCRRAPGQS